MIELDELLSKVDEFHDDDVSELAPAHRGDSRDGRIYAVSTEITIAVKVAIATGRPLLLSGPPGCGKSSLASYIARNLGLAYFEYTVVEGADPQDLLWRMDTVRRFNDAQVGGLREIDGEFVLYQYLEPGPLWWCLDPASASTRGAPPEVVAQSWFRKASAQGQLPGHPPTRAGSVLLIDEIDKADSSFCNGLLVPLGSRQFSVPPIDRIVAAADRNLPASPIVVITNNNERDLPEAFIRRCVALSIAMPGEEKLKEIARRHFGQALAVADHQEQMAILAKRLTSEEYRQQAGRGVSTAEFLDLVQTLLTLGIAQGSKEWEIVERLVVEKRDVRSTRLLEW